MNAEEETILLVSEFSDEEIAETIRLHPPRRKLDPYKTLQASSSLRDFAIKEAIARLLLKS